MASELQSKVKQYDSEAATQTDEEKRMWNLAQSARDAMKSSER